MSAVRTVGMLLLLVVFLNICFLGLLNISRKKFEICHHEDCLTIVFEWRSRIGGAEPSPVVAFGEKRLGFFLIHGSISFSAYNSLVLAVTDNGWLISGSPAYQKDGQIPKSVNYLESTNLFNLHLDRLRDDAIEGGEKQLGDRDLVDPVEIYFLIYISGEYRLDKFYYENNTLFDSDDIVKI